VLQDWGSEDVQTAEPVLRQAITEPAR